jgi:hypothetical protein
MRGKGGVSGMGEDPEAGDFGLERLALPLVFLARLPQPPPHALLLALAKGDQGRLRRLRTGEARAPHGYGCYSIAIGRVRGIAGHVSHYRVDRGCTACIGLLTDSRGRKGFSWCVKMDYQAA